MNLDELAEGYALQVLKKIGSNLQTAWEEVAEADRAEVQEAAADVGRLTFQAMSGQDVAQEIRHAQARALSWSFVHASHVRQEFLSAIKDAAVFAGELALKLVSSS